MKLSTTILKSKTIAGSTQQSDELRELLEVKIAGL